MAGRHRGRKQRLSLRRIQMLAKQASGGFKNPVRARLGAHVAKREQKGMPPLEIAQSPLGPLALGHVKVMLLADGSVALFGERDPVLRKLAGRKAGQVERASEGGAVHA